MKNKALAIAGPTASGKTSLAIELSERYGGEIVSCDSMQIYREMNIGTAKPTAEERARVPHHLVDILSVGESYSVASYVQDANRVCAELAERGVFPIICGGTGLYLEALRDRRFDSSAPAGDQNYRTALKLLSESEEGKMRLYDMLRELDPISAEAIHPNNTKRVIRALEIHHLSSMPKSEWDERSRQDSPDTEDRLDIDVVALSFKSRAVLHERIEQRTNAMLREGLLDEIAHLDSIGAFDDSDSTASAAIGYKELLPALRGEMPLDECIERLKGATRRYAKRQITWYSHREGITTIYADRDDGSLKSVAELADEVEAIFPYLVELRTERKEKR